MAIKRKKKILHKTGNRQALKIGVATQKLFMSEQAEHQVEKWNSSPAMTEDHDVSHSEFFTHC